MSTVTALTTISSDIYESRGQFESVLSDKTLNFERELEALRKDAERLDFVEFFAQEPDDWDRKHGACKNGDVWIWKFYAPAGARGSTRAIIDAAIDAAKESK